MIFWVYCLGFEEVSTIYPDLLVGGVKDFWCFFCFQFSM